MNKFEKVKLIIRKRRHFLRTQGDCKQERWIITNIITNLKIRKIKIRRRRHVIVTRFLRTQGDCKQERWIIDIVSRIENSNNIV